MNNIPQVETEEQARTVRQYFRLGTRGGIGCIELVDLGHNTEAWGRDEIRAVNNYIDMEWSNFTHRAQAQIRAICAGEKVKDEVEK